MKRTKNDSTPTAMKRSWLVQRLTKPRTPKGPFAALGTNPFAFGGGLKNGGLSDDAMTLIRDIFGFDYMGAAEFEFGAVPDALRHLAQDADRGHLSTATLDLALADVSPPYTWKKGQAIPDETHTIYVLGYRDHLDEITSRIREWAGNGPRPQLKETTRLDAVLWWAHSGRDWTEDVAGWLELDNGFMFFTDREMWEKSCALFGVEVDEAAA